MSVTAAQILHAIRKKYRTASVVREVTIPDEYERGRWNRWCIDTGGRGPVLEAELIARGEPIAKTLPAGWQPKPYSPGMTRRIDALMFDASGRTAIEIKVTRADFKRDTIDKRRPWMDVTNRFIYAVPKGLVSPDEVGDTCGLWEFDYTEWGESPWKHGLSTAKNAKRNKTARPLPREVLMALASRVSRYEYAEQRQEVTA